MSARYKDEQALVQLTQRAVTQESAGKATTVISSAALRSVPYEDLQVEVYGACRSFRNQAATIEGANR